MMKKLLVLLALSFNAEACYVVNGYVYCPPPPVVYQPPPVIVNPPPVYVPYETGSLVK
jgi:hypothetical protein